MKRRRFLGSVAAALVAPAPASAVVSEDGSGPAGRGAPLTRLAAAWRGPQAASQQLVGVLEADWDRRSVSIRAALPVPGRAHGLLPEPGGGFVAVAYRFGTWLWRVDAAGRPSRQLRITDEPGERRFSGHVVASADRGALFTTEIDPTTGAGFVGVRDPHTLAKVDEWRCHGDDAHQLLFAPDGHLVVANGGVLRTPDDRKRDLSRMDSSLVVLDGRNGHLRGQWQLDDTRLSLRHMAYSAPERDERPLLGIALQAEHDDTALRDAAPVLAIFDGERLVLPSRDGNAVGYAGDIAAAGAGFVVSCQKAGQALWWRREAPTEFAPIARLSQVCAVSPVATPAGGVVVAAALGIGRWHPKEPAALLRWPQPMALDNHWVELAAA
jgi:hypothetical protein